MIFIAFKPLKAEKNIEVKVHKNIELIRIVWTQAFSKKLPKDSRPSPSIYYDDVKDYFKKYKKHSAIKLMKKHWIYDYSFPKIGALLNSNYEIKEKEELHSWYERYGEEVIDEFLVELKSFAEISNYNEFYQSQEKNYKLMVEDFERSINSSSWLSDVCGLFDCGDLKKVQIYFEPLNNCGNYEMGRVKKIEGLVEIGIAYFTDNPKELSKVPPSPVKLEFEEWLRRVFYHELCHYFTSSNTEDKLELFTKDYSLFFKDKTGKEFAVWKNQIDESIVRSYVAYLYKKSVNVEEGIKEITNQGINYPQVKTIYELIEDKGGKTGFYDKEIQIEILEELIKKIRGR